jgi:hypothetical protein
MNRAWILPVLVVVLRPAPLHAGDLYVTDFEAFSVGDNRWAGTEGWISNDTISGAQGILQDFVAELPLGRTAYLGFDRPAASLTTVARPVNYNTETGGFPCVEFESFLGIQDSTNGRRDQFFISFYDIGGSFLAAIVFDNTRAHAEMLKWKGMGDGSVQISGTGVPFARGDQTLGFVALQILYVRIDLGNNQWTAELDGLPLFVDAAFTDSALAPLTLGSIAAEWELAEPSPTLAGDNWLFVADWFVRAAPKALGPVKIESIARSASGETTLTWLGEPGFDYRVEYSADLVAWDDDLPGSAFPNIATVGLLSFTDLQSSPSQRFYRVARSVTP